jgi:hypothetical protein
MLVVASEVLPILVTDSVRPGDWSLLDATVVEIHWQHSY